MDALAIVSTLAVALGASWTAGINLYATVGVLGLLHRFTAFDLPGDLQVLGHPAVIGVAVVLYCVEFVADKVPAVDSAWDTIHTFIRVPAGAVIAAMALGDVPTEIQLCAALLGGTLAFGSHATKATTRLATHATGTSPILGPVLSVGEDVLVIGGMALIAANPVLALLVFTVLIIGMFFLLRACWRLTRRVIASLGSLGRRPAEAPAAA